MAPETSMRQALGVALVLGGALAAIALGAPPEAAIPAAIGGVAALFVQWSAGAQVEVQHRPVSLKLEELSSIIGSFAEPALVLDGIFAVAANQAAFDLLGSHILQQDARVAIRHPAAAGLLGTPDAKGSALIEGLGGRERVWQLDCSPIGGGRRLVRLEDRTAGRLAERARTDFVANASHELRTPLAAILGYVETLQTPDADADTETRMRFLQVIEREARRMQRLIDDLMSLSRIEAGKFVAPGARVDLGALVRDAAHEAASVHGRSEADILLAPGDGSWDVEGDRMQLSQLVANLVSNALRYGKAGGAVRVALAAEGEQAVRLTVADEGEGIAPEHIPRLTERFYRVDQARSRSTGGTGLGLAIVKHIAERHRATLDIRSELGSGTTVSVTFPLAR